MVPMVSAGATSLPAALAELLVRAHRAERVASGAARRDAFRRTRSLLGGARALGYPVEHLGACLGLSAAAVRSRAGVDGRLTVADLHTLVGRHEGIEAWLRNGPAFAGGRVGDEAGYRASEVIRAVIASDGQPI